MSRLVIVSNRLPIGRPSGAGGELEIPAGGLVSAVLSALQRRPGSLWLGWDSKAEPKPDRLTQHQASGVLLLGLGLSRAELDGYYRGFCNETLWPLLHCFQGRVHLDVNHAAFYRRVQTRFARALHSILRAGDLVWVHDYHLLLLGRELRQLGWKGKIGFFLHTPFPPYDLWRILPNPADFLRALGDYNLVGFHTASYRDNYLYSCKRELKASWSGSELRTTTGRQRVGVYPVGIEPRDFQPEHTGRRKQHRYLSRIVGSDVQVVLGVDRLDYTKGIPERIRAFESLIRRWPQWRGKVCLVQIASPSRTTLHQYEEQKRLVDRLVGRVNGELADPDWVPIRYLYRSFSRSGLIRFYSAAHVGLVTPLRDGMNLVAKEFVAGQYPEDPGVLVLSRFAGAAEELSDAIQVNPYLPDDTAEGIARALEMPLEERCKRHQALFAEVSRATASEWARRFTADLANA